MSPVDDLASANDESEEANTPVGLKLDREERCSIKSVEKEESEAKLDQRVNDPLDPLRDASSIDPSQLFAFVTKTPSPEKSNALLFNEDDSLFSSASSQASEKANKEEAKKTDFFDDAGEDLFSAPLLKSGKKPLKDTKISLFDDDDVNDEDEDSLFGSKTKKSVDKIDPQKSAQSSEQSSLSQKGFFESDSEDLFADGPKKIDVPVNKTKTSDMRDIFGDQSSGEEDLFAFKKTIPKKSATETKSLFNDDDDDEDDIFGKPTSSMSKATESRASIKKAVTRDLKKTAEQIVEDPLSTLQDD